MAVGLEEADFQVLKRWIEAHLGVKMPPSKRPLLETRLQKRLIALEMSSFRQYLRYLSEEAGGEEWLRFVDLVTTHKTDFFREPEHFSYLTEEILPGLLQRVRGQKIRIWSAGCATGEELYSIGMVMEEFFRNQSEMRGGGYSVLGSDVSMASIKRAKSGIYETARLQGMPQSFRYRYFMRSKQPNHNEVRVVPELRRQMEFLVLNFMDPSYAIPYLSDVIFFRNVMIYFEKQTQREVLHKLCEQLKPGGYLLVGHSETIQNLSLPLRNLGPAIFQKI